MIRPIDSFSPGSKLAQAVQNFCLERFEGPAGPTTHSVPAWDPLLAAGTELWLDTGDIDVIDKLWCKEAKALTTNNTLLNREVQKGIYDGLVPEAAAMLKEVVPGISDHHLVLEIAFILNAVHGLTLVGRFGGKVSVELHTELARNIEASVAYGKRYHEICRSHFIVKVPLTPEGIIAARRLSDADIPINFTLGFSARQNFVIAALARPSWCNVFMGRINAFLADHGLGDGKNAGERATVASQRGLYRLREQGIPTLQIGASMRSADQIKTLAGLDVYTAPPAVAQGYLDDPSLQEGVSNRMDADFPVDFGDTEDPDAEGLNVFWTIDEATGAAVAALISQDIGQMSATDLKKHLEEAGAGSLFPSMDAEELVTLEKGGKIPSYETWREGVREGRLAWDSLLTLGGLLSFAQDQAALDQRIQQHIH